MTHSKVSIGGGNFPASHGDSRDGLGYGRLRPTYGMKSMGNNYPYTAEEDSDFDWEDADVDEEDIAAVSIGSKGRGIMITLEDIMILFLLLVETLN